MRFFLLFFLLGPTAFASQLADSPELVAQRMRADRVPFFRALGSTDRDFARNPLRQRLSQLVLCEIASDYAQSQCDWLQRDFGFQFPGRSVELTQFSQSPENSRLVGESLAGIFRGALGLASGSLATELREMLNETGSLLAQEKIQPEEMARLIESLRAKAAIAHALSEGSLTVFAKLIRELSSWAGSRRDVDAIQGESHETIALGASGEVCVLREGQLKCWQTGRAPLPKELGNVRDVAGYEKGICALDESGVLCWQLSVPGSTKRWSIRGGRKLAVTPSGGSCVIVGEEVKCEGEEKSPPSPPTNARFRSPVAIAISERVGCVIDRDGLKCWGKSDSNSQSMKVEPLPDFPNPRALSAGPFQVCAIVDGQVKCTGQSYEAIPKLKNPRAVAAGYYRVCAVDDDGLRCWGQDPDSRYKAPALGRVTSLTANWYGACAYDEKGVHCWGHGFGETVPKDFRNPTVVAGTSTSTCALDEGTAKCWSLNSMMPAPVAPALKNPRALTGGKSHYCAIDDEGVKCWRDNSGERDFGGASPRTDLRNPRALWAGQNHTCAQDDEGFKCWGGPFLKPEFVLPAMTRPHAAALTGWDSCFLDGNELKCALSRNSSLHYLWPKLVAPTALGIGPYHICAIDQGRLNCNIGSDPYGRKPIAIPPSDLKNVRELGSGHNSNCVIDDEGAKCWNADFNMTPPDDMKQPHSLMVHDYYACAIDGNRVRCWGALQYGD